VDGSLHKIAYEIWPDLGRRPFFLTDCISGETMQHYKVEQAFGFNRHFVEQGFEIMGERTERQIKNFQYIV
jgi:hypothetical protein